ncbi:hypothetical protein K474DRAFT_891328 [Panus rudis PR-1116 ss-1]|nr:hypothetical protein K474DRAFT_891328 [Panus rudis PR-1116 ss-1]
MWALNASQKLPSVPLDDIPPWFTACGSHFSDAQTHYLAITLAIAMLFDIIIFALTLYKCLTLAKLVHNSISSLMMRDGTVYFGLLIVSYLLNLLSNLLCRDCIEVSTFTTVIASTLISRLMLNLRDPKDIGMALTQETTVGTLTFVH